MSFSMGKYEASDRKQKKSTTRLTNIKAEGRPNYEEEREGREGHASPIDWIIFGNWPVEPVDSLIAN